MINKFIKKILLILTIITMFFIGINKVSAQVCHYEAPLSYMNENGLATYLQVEYTHHYGIVNSETATTTTKIDRFHLECDTDTQSCSFGIQTEQDLLVNNEENISLYNPFYMTENLIFREPCPDYVRYIIYYEDYEDDKSYLDNTILPANQSMYEDKLQKLYLNKVPTEHRLYGLVTIKADNKDKPLEEEFIKYIQSIDGIILINTSLSEKYPAEKLSKFTSELKRKGKESSLEKFPIDREEYNKITYNKVYYDTTKNLWKKYMEDDIKNPKKADSKRKEYFSNWFNNISRYIFEEDLDLFRKYYVYLFEGQTNLVSESDYDNILDAIDSMLIYETAESEENCYVRDYCYTICGSQCSGPAYTQCAANSDEYKKCSNAYKNCKTAQGGAFDDCMEVTMGEDDYENIKNAREERREEIEETKEDALDAIVSSLSKVQSPTISGININKDGYKANCDDVVFLHDLYVVLKILAPVLVILMGTIDFAKSVIAGDEKKIVEARKKFPKRLILLILFILVPFIIEVLLGAFSGAETSLMRCVIKGA